MKAKVLAALLLLSINTGCDDAESGADMAMQLDMAAQSDMAMQDDMAMQLDMAVQDDMATDAIAPVMDMMVEIDMAPDPDMGMMSAFEQHCQVCHGVAGEGTNLGYALEHPTREFYTWVVRNGRAGGRELQGEMPMFTEDQLSDAELTEIWDFLDMAPQPVTGETLYMDYCRNCHGADAAGGYSRRTLLRESRRRIISKARRGERERFSDRHEYMPAFGADVLTDDELGLIADYIGSL